MTRSHSDLDVASAPADDIPAALRRAWSDLLGVAAPTPASNFYAAGGTSLTVALLLAKMHQHGAAVRLAELVACTTFAEQLDMFGAGRVESATARDDGLFPVQHLRLAQIVRQIKTDGTASVKPLAIVLEIAGDVDIDLLAQSMTDVVRRHAVLSMGFVNEDGVIAPTPTAFADSWTPERIDLSAYSTEEAQSRVWELVAETAAKGLAFDTTTLILGAVATVRPDLTIAVLVVDHLVCDAESRDILFRDLAEIYSARVERRPHDLAALGRQDDLVEPQRYGDDDRPMLVEKWRELVDGYPRPPAFDLLGGTDARDYGPTVPSLAATAQITLLAGTATKLTATYRHLGLPPLAVMLGATYLAVHIISGAQDICLVNPRSRRNTVGATHAVNDFAEPSIIRLRYEGTSCPCESPLREIAAMAAAGYAAASELEMPFEMIRAFTHDAGNSTARALIASTMRAIDRGSESQASDDVLPWVWCSYSKAGPRSHRMGTATATSLGSLDTAMHSTVVQPNLWVYIEDDGTNILVEMIAPEKLYDSVVVSEFGAALGRVLHKFADSPDAPISASDPTPCLTTTHLRQPA